MTRSVNGVALKRQPNRLLDKAPGCTETVCDVQSKRDRGGRQAGSHYFLHNYLKSLITSKKCHIIRKTPATPLLSGEHNSIMKQL